MRPRSASFFRRVSARRPGMRAVLLLLLALATPTLAQSIPEAPDVCGPISAAALGPVAALAPGESGQAVLTVTNDGEANVLVVARMQVEGQGWTGDTADQRRRVAPGASVDFQFNVSPTEGTTTEGRALFVAGGTCEAPNPTVPCPAQACTVPEVTAQARLPYQAPEGLDIPFLDQFRLPLEGVLAGVVLIGLVAGIVVLARRAPRALVADAPEPLKMVRPGRGASFPVVVRNPSREAVSAQLEVGAVPEGWSAFMPLPDLQLAPREERNLFLMVRAPEEAQAGQAVDVEVTVRDAARPSRDVVVRVRAEVHESAV